jgi:TRAP-type C4-dicarboxylate transport system substrate-binding protein
LALKLFPDSTLGNAQAMISGVRGGTIDMEMSGSNNFTGWPRYSTYLMFHSCFAIPHMRIKRSTVKSAMN